MDNSKTNDIDSMMDSIRPIFDATKSIVQDMKDNERKPVKQMAAMVGLAIGMEPVKALPFVNHFAHNTKTGYVSSGRYGGFVRSNTGKPLQTVKTNKTETSTETDITEDTIDE